MQLLTDEPMRTVRFRMSSPSCVSGCGFECRCEDRLAYRLSSFLSVCRVKIRDCYEFCHDVFPHVFYVIIP